MQMKGKIITILLVWLAMANAGWGQTYQPGFRTLGAWEEEPAVRVDLNIWYPTTRRAKEVEYPPWVLTVAPNSRPAQGAFPLLLLSHDTPTDRFAYHTLAASLASKGFVVVAPGHGSDNMNNMDDLFTWRQLDRRARELGKALDLVMAEKDLGENIDATRIGLIGFGSGATAALLLGGALPNCSNWGRYCPRAGKNDVYCSPWAVDRLISLCGEFPLTQSLADTRIKAIAAIAPGFGMLFDADSFKYFYPPLLLVSAGRSQFNRASLHCEPLGRLLGHRARFLDLPIADTGALMSPCSPALASELPEMCNSVTEEERRQIHLELYETLLSFFQHYLLKPGNLPVIAAPPDLAPPAPVQPAKVVEQGRKKDARQRSK